MAEKQGATAVLPPLHNQASITIGLRVTLADTKGLTPAQQEAFWRGVALVMAAVQSTPEAKDGSDG
jgi:hypothetical protein